MIAFDRTFYSDEYEIWFINVLLSHSTRPIFIEITSMALLPFMSIYIISIDIFASEGSFSNGRRILDAFQIRIVVQHGWEWKTSLTSDILVAKIDDFGTSKIIETWNYDTALSIERNISSLQLHRLFRI